MFQKFSLKIHGVRTHVCFPGLLLVGWNGEGRSVAAGDRCVLEPMDFSIVVFLNCENIQLRVEIVKGINEKKPNAFKVRTKNGN